MVVGAQERRLPALVRGSINSQRLQYFVRVAESGSLTSAAESMGISQPSMSAALRKLEREIGVVLFNRLGRGVSLTPEGIQLLEHARTAIEGVNRFSDAAAALRSDSYGSVSVAAPAGVSISVLGPLAAAFVRAHPQGQVRVVRTYGLSDTIDAVRLGQAEVALLPRLVVPDGLTGIEVGSYELALALPPQIELPPGPVRPSSFAEHPFITSHPGTVADRLMNEARRLGARPRIVMVEPDIGLLPRLVARGVGAAIVTTGLASELNALGLDVRLFAPREVWPVRLIHRPSSLTPAALRFVEVAETVATARRDPPEAEPSGPRDSG